MGMTTCYKFKVEGIDHACNTMYSHSPVTGANLIIFYIIVNGKWVWYVYSLAFICLHVFDYVGV